MIRKNRLESIDDLKSDYKAKLFEFYIAKGNEKFNYNDKTMRFKDGTFMGRWFNLFCLIILSSTDNLSQKIKENYEKYSTLSQKAAIEKRKVIYERKLFAFMKESDFNKFKKTCKSITFDDNTFMNNWFLSNFARIICGSDETSLIIQEQYAQYCNFKIIYANNKEGYKEEDAKEFLDDPNLDKFMENSNIRFRNGKSKGKWFYNNILELRKSKSKYACEILEQYEKFNKSLKSAKQAQINDEYEKRKKDFANYSGLDKFNKDGSVLFEDGFLMQRWFFKYKNILTQSHDELSLKIIEQYEAYVLYNKQRIKRKREKEYENKRHEFKLIDDLNKFKANSKIKLKSGISAVAWFYYYKDKLSLATDEESKEIMIQFEKYKNLQISIKNEQKILAKKNREAKFEDRKIEFSMQLDKKKFSGCFYVPFKDGVSMGNWFNIYKKIIFNSNDNASLQIKEQYLFIHPEYSCDGIVSSKTKYVDSDEKNLQKKIKNYK